MADDSEDVFESAQSPTHPTLNICIDQQIPKQIFCCWALAPNIVSGLLIGKQSDCKVEVMVSIELKFKFDNQDIIDENYCHKAKQLYKDLEILGWYTIGSELIERHINVHYQICNITQCPIVLQLNAETGKVNILGTVIAVVQGKPAIKFVTLPYTNMKNLPSISNMKNLPTLDPAASTSKHTGSSLVNSILASPSNIPSVVVSLNPIIVHKVSLRCIEAEEGSSVVGILIGKQINCNVEIMESFELELKSVDEYLHINNIVDISKVEKICKNFYKDYDILGWYTNGSKITEQDIKIHKQFREIIKRSDFPELPIMMKICPQSQNFDKPNTKIYGTSIDTNSKNDEDNLLFFKLGVNGSINQQESLTKLKEELKKEKDRAEVYNKCVNPILSTIMPPLILLFPTKFQIFVYIFFLGLFLYFIRHHIMKKLKYIRKLKR